MSRPLIVWQDPPAGRKTRKLKHAKYIHALRERPGEWACLQRNENRRPLDSLRVSLVSTPAYAELAHPYQLHVTVKRTPSGDFGIWARLSEQP